MKSTITSKLALWYAEHGRSLPWRDLVEPDAPPLSGGRSAPLTATDVAYRVWLSEIILQQTTVRQGTDYYLRFTERWPSIESLATATEDEILREWQGLGYYTRARNLHKAAQQVVELGKFPSTYQEILKLKGVGPYTAAAIASIAFGEPRAVVDGNVYRVLARYYAIDTPIDSPAGQRDFAELANAILDKRQPGRHNQAIMDFGALQCTPHSPHCSDCPLADTCLALQQGRVGNLPFKARRTKVTEVDMHYSLVCSADGLFLRQRPAKGIWAKLWEVVDTAEAAQKSTCLADTATCLADIIANMQPLGIFRHVLTHRRITCHASALYLTSEAQRVALTTHLARHGYHFVTWANIEHYALPRLIENIIAKYRANH